MLNKGVKELGVENQVVVKDIAELLLQSVVVKDEISIKERVDLGIDQEVRHV